MRDSNKGGKKPIEEVEQLRRQKARLEHLSRDTAKHRNTKEVLRGPKDLYQAVMENAYFSITLIDVNYKILMVNNAVSKIFHKPACEFIGQECFREFEKRESICSHCPGRRAMATGQPVEAETKGVRDDGSHFSVRIQAFPTSDLNGVVTGFIEIIEDITQRKKAEELLESERQRLYSLLDGLPAFVYLQAPDHSVRFANRYFREHFGDTEGKPCYEVLWGAKEPCKPCPTFRVFQTKEPQVWEWSQSPDGRIYEINDYPFSDIDGSPLVLELGIDITERKKAEEELKAFEERFSSLTERSFDIIFMTDAQGYLTYISAASERIFHYKPEEMVGTHFKNYLIESEIPRVSQRFAENMQGRNLGILPMEAMRKDGSHVFVELNSSPIIRDGETIGIQGIIRDITEHKKAEEKLLKYQGQLKQLASQLTLAEEHERRRVANGLHDQISQSLASSKMELDALRHRVSPKDPGKALKEVSDSLGKAIDDVRSLTFDLSFPILYELGFETAVAEWLADQIEEKHRIATEFEDDGQPKPLDEDVRIFLFRDVRELLMNVVKHAQANKVKVSIRRVGRQIQVRVEDDGIGFDPEKVAATAVRKGGFGLFSIRERLEQLGARLDIESAPGRGTKVTLIAPLKQEKIDKGEKR